MSGNTLIQRLWNRDLSLWSPGGQLPEEVENRLGWLDAVSWMQEYAAGIKPWADGIIDSGKFNQVVLLGMGGSSLAAEVFHQVFGCAAGRPEFLMLDSTNAEHIKNSVPSPQSALFIVSSKSGSTLETADLMAYFYGLLEARVPRPGENFVAITDPGSGLQAFAENRGFTRIFLNPSDIGGRYSALSYFGLVPACLMGVDLESILEATEKFAMASLTEAGREVEDLAVLMAGADSSGIHTVQIQIERPFGAMGLWIEQLVAESLGKCGKGVVPVVRSNNADVSQAGSGDGGPAQVIVSVCSGNDRDVASLNWEIQGQDGLGAEFLRWEMATALAASLMNINPFDQPDVERAKIRTREIINGEESADLPREVVHGNYGCVVSVEGAGIDGLGVAQFLSRISGCSYLAILAYLPMDPETSDALEAMGEAMAQQTGIDVIPGFGPRYLHSTGQLHKGGPGVGAFVQLVEETSASEPIPGRHYGFAELHRAQADGDYSVLQEIGRPIMRITIKTDRLGTLARITEILKSGQ